MSQRVSIAMIVRDEAEMEAGFIEAARGLWDELVVVDTGSVDGTLALFGAAGATVSQEPWTGSFAAARNASLDRVTGEWVLVLDADERVSPEFIREFRAAIEDPTLGALTVRMSNPLPHGHRRESQLLRAFRRDAGIRYEHAIHEDASHSVHAMLSRTGRRLGHLGAPVEHLGYVRSRAAAKDKKQRDLTLLGACIEQDPRDFYSHLKVLEQARFWRDARLWREASTAALAALNQAGKNALAGRPWGGELIALIGEGLFGSDSQEGLSLLDAWAPQLLPSAALLHRRARVHEALGNLDLAQSDFERCLALSGSPGDLQLTTVRPLLGLSRLAIVRGELRGAQAHALRALGLNGLDPEALTAVAALTLHLDARAGLDAWVARHREQEPHCPERDVAVGEALFSAREYRQAVAALRRAAGEPPGGPVAVRLAQALLAEGSFEASEALAQRLMKTNPEAGLGVLLFDLAAGRDSNLDLDIEAETAQEQMREWVEALLATGDQAWIRRFAANASAVEELFPWLADHLRRRVG